MGNVEGGGGGEELCRTNAFRKRKKGNADNKRAREGHVVRNKI